MSQSVILLCASRSSGLEPVVSELVVGATGAEDSVPVREKGGVVAHVVSVMEIVVGGGRTERNQPEGRPRELVAGVSGRLRSRRCGRWSTDGRSRGACGGREQ